MRRDLFGEQRGGLCLAVAWLDSLAMETLEDVAAPYREQGWKWVETAFQRPDWIFNIRPTSRSLFEEAACFVSAALSRVVAGMKPAFLRSLGFWLKIRRFRRSAFS